MTAGSLIAMAGRSIADPREGAAEILSLGIPRRALGLIAALVVTLSVIAGQLLTLLVGAVPIAAHPGVAGIVQTAILLLTVGAVHWLGRLFGGSGRFEEALLLVCWLQFIMLLLQVAQLGLLLLMPPLAVFLGFASVAVFLWCLTGFVAVLHGFPSRGMVFLAIMGAGAGAAIVLQFLLASAGLGLEFGMGGA